MAAHYDRCNPITMKEGAKRVIGLYIEKEQAKGAATDPKKLATMQKYLKSLGEGEVTKEELITDSIIYVKKKLGLNKHQAEAGEKTTPRRQEE